MVTTSLTINTLPFALPLNLFVPFHYTKRIPLLSGLFIKK